MADYYNQLIDSEKCYWNVYTRLRQLSDWAAFTSGQDEAKTSSRAWLVARRKTIYREAESVAGGWDVNNRRQRYTQLADDSLNSGSPRNLCQLPTGGTTDTEKVKISEREVWWNQSAVDDATQRWRDNCTGWLIDRRKQVWHLGEDEGWDANYRRQRYDALCVATKTGQAYTSWSASHNDHTGAKNPPPPTSSGAASSRAQAVAAARSYLGVSENPPSSNRGSPQPSGWQKRVYGDDGVPWCACFTTCMAWDAGAIGSSSAAVQYIVSLAQQGQGMFRGWTTDPANVLQGDMAVVSCTTCHIGLVADSDDACHLIEGNTSPGSEGSQFNGGCVAEKRRARSEIVGWALVDYP